MCPPETVASGLNPPMDRYVFEKEREGRTFKKTFKHVALSIKDLEDFYQWRTQTRAQTRERRLWVRVDPVLRMWKSSCGSLIYTDVESTYDQGWVQLSQREEELYSRWRNELSMRLRVSDDEDMVEYL